MQHFVHGCQKLKLAQLRYESDEALRTTVLKAVIHQLLLYHWAAWTLWLKPWKMCPYQYHWRVCVNIHFEQISAMERRGALLSALSQLSLAHPALPQLRDFQVNLGPFHTWLTKLLTMSSRFSLVGHIGKCPGSKWSKPHPLCFAYRIRQNASNVTARSPLASRC